MNVNSTRSLTNCGLCFTIAIILFLYSGLATRVLVTSFVLMICAKRSDYRYSILLSILIPLYELTQGLYPKAMYFYVIFIMLANISLVVALKYFVYKDILIATFISYIARILVLQMGLLFPFDNTTALFFMSYSFVTSFHMCAGLLAGNYVHTLLCKRIGNNNY